MPTLNTFAYVEYTSIQVTGLFTESGWVNTKIGLWWFGLCLPVMYILQFSDVLTILNSHLNCVSHTLEYQNKYLRCRKTKSKSTYVLKRNGILLQNLF